MAYDQPSIVRRFHNEDYRERLRGRTSLDGRYRDEGAVTA
jgi:hypothetical protein